MRLVLCAVCLVNLSVVIPLAAQQLEPAFVRWEPPAAWLASDKARSAETSGLESSVRRDYRHEGLAFGGIVFGALGAWVGSRLSAACPTVPGAECNTDRLGNAVALGLVGAAAGGGLGYLVGRLSPKVDVVEPILIDMRPSPVIPDSIRRVVGYHHWKGAVIGSVAGAAAGTFLGLMLRGGCSDCDVAEGDFLKAGLVSAGAGGVFGFLVGSASPKYEWAPADGARE
jgi:hypothetical protein